MGCLGISHVMECVLNHSNAIGFIIATGLAAMVIKKWIGGGWCKSKALLHGKTAIVTGSNTGIGKETARDLARRGARVILACRDLDKAVKAAREIEVDSKGEVVVRHLDLGSIKSIHKFTKDILATESQINILVNNAGLVAGKGTTEDGFDLTFGTNHLGPFLLTNLLLPKIKESAPARIVNLSSMAYKFGVMNWDDLHYQQDFSTVKAYSQSKLANVYFTTELARRLQGTRVTVYAVHPGAVASDLGRNLPDYCPLWLRVLFTTFGPYMTKSTTQGAQTSIHCAVSEEAENQSGLYYTDCKPKKLTTLAMNEEAAKKLWDISGKMVKLEDQAN